ncbi:dynamin family protein [Actinoplanes regularis]|uniref:dynamin family protein n=1 Tax=Actinoplanes regularis TaxID=52697 RepID=UPI0024A5CD9C|nr:dynamin family protein [Actinoplanes regularis]GLW30382.1 GTPase [Actinoplanes regularis]
MTAAEPRMGEGLLDRTRLVLDEALVAYRGGRYESRLHTVRERLSAPLRVAIAGRVKAGKSTLLNALIGERLAPTDAGECTRIVTWYQDGTTYRVTLRPREGAPRQARFARDEGALEIDLGGLSHEEVADLLVEWPSQTLRTATLVDTPGVGSLRAENSRRTWDLLAPDDEDTPADAVIYLMRHAHRDDLNFLQAFHDRQVSAPNPVNAIGVLSRADEIGGGRLDTLASATRIAARMAADVNVRRLVQTVVPIAGLLAETAVTLTEAEVAHLRRVADLPARTADDLLLSADRFRERLPELGLTSIERDALLARFGLFGVRLAAALLRRKVAGTATELSEQLTERSGLRALQRTLDSLFFERREILKSRSALLAVDSVIRADPAPAIPRVAGAVEEIIASAHPFNELRVLASLRAGWVTGKPAVVAELERVIGGEGTAAHLRLQLPAEASRAELVAAASESLARWQRRAENPLTRYELSVAARVAVRSCEGVLAELHRGRR